jgi:hypothetical protein
MHCLLLLLCISFLSVSLSKLGLDLSIYIPTTGWSSTISTALPGSTVNTTFLAVHGYFYNNTVNGPGIQTIQTAWYAGIRDISVYFFPCIGTSQYAVSTNLFCDTPKKQLDKLLTSLQRSNIFFRRTNESSTSSSHNHIVLQTLYINIEDTAPNFYFSQYHYENFQYMKTFVKYAQSKNIEIGFYTTFLDWKIVMTDALPIQYFTDIREYVYYVNHSHFLNHNPFSGFKLWVPRYDKINSMSFYTKFGNWSEAYMKQTSGGTTDFRRIGSSRVGTNYKLDRTNQTYGYVPLSI